MKKIIYVTLLIIMIPYIIVSIFIYDDEIKFNYTSNMVVRVKRNATGKIEEVPLEKYVAGVVSGEMPVSFSSEALKSQAVAARTYVMKRLVDNRKRSYDVVDTVTNQVYLDEEQQKKRWGDNYTKYSNKVKQAVLETKDEYLVYNGKIIDALFFSTSVGVTENSEDVFINEIPYLRSVSSTWDSVSPLYDKEYIYTLKKFHELLGLSYKDNVTIEVTNKSNSGRVNKIKINGKEFSGWSVANKLGLKSNYYSITQKGNQITVVARGYGHGVGMSQYGAEGMAQAGYKYDEILKHYYQGTEIKKI
ncbi:MAG: stage II sporulation protein D [Clostridium sp.]|nr:stage II sporulation protein D [Clostridium sp.]MCM1443937.1 stage II sporulation protein D [Candidatus Amulumruptor caecigallinarius]